MKSIEDKIKLLKELAYELNECPEELNEYSEDEELELENKFYLFEELIYDVRLEGDESVIEDLSLLIDDNFFEPAIMEDIIEIIISIIEKCDFEEGIYIVLNNIDKIIIKGRFFLKEFIKMTLNEGNKFIDYYIFAINKLDVYKKSIAVQILDEIKIEFVNSNRIHKEIYISLIEKIIEKIIK